MCSTPDELSMVAFDQDGPSLGIPDLAFQESKGSTFPHSLRLDLDLLPQLGSLRTSFHHLSVVCHNYTFM